jgi:hypothetical protein
MTWEESVQGAMQERKILMTKTGYVGLTLPDTRLDTVCILGAPMPYVLRRMGSHFRLVDEYFIDGVMHGEALKGLDTATSGAEDTKNDLPKIQVFEIWSRTSFWVFLVVLVPYTVWHSATTGMHLPHTRGGEKIWGSGGRLMLISYVKKLLFSIS